MLKPVPPSGLRSSPEPVRRPTRRDKHGENGSVTVLAVAAIVVIVLLGIAFLQIAKAQRVSGAATVRANYARTATNATVDFIARVIGRDWEAYLQDDPASEYEDFPGPQDRWLATIEPDGQATKFGQPALAWRQISLVSINPADTADTAYINAETMAELGAAKAPDQLLLYVGSTDMSEWADADADGWIDSRWVRIPTPVTDGVVWIAAIRVIDNSGLVNVNVATEGSWTAADTVGRTPADVDLYRLLVDGAGADPWSAAFHSSGGLLESLGFSASSALDQNTRDNMWDALGRIFTSTSLTPFGLADEIELRRHYRWNNPSLGALEWALDRPPRPPLRSDSVENPVDSPGSANDVFADRRHLLTTYSGAFSARRRFSSDTQVGRGRQQDVYASAVDLLRDLPGLFHMALTHNSANYEGRAEEVAAALAVNLVAAREQTHQAVSVNGRTYHGLRPQPFLREALIAYFYEDADKDGEFSPDDNHVKTWAVVEIGNPYTFEIALDNFELNLGGERATLTGTLPAGRWMIVHNDGGGLDDHLPGEADGSRKTPIAGWPNGANADYTVDSIEIIDRDGGADVVVDRFTLSDVGPLLDESDPPLPQVPDWVAGTAYHEDDFVRNGGTTYRCTVGSSDLNLQPSVNVLEWVEEVGQVLRFKHLCRDDRAVPAGTDSWRYVYEFDDANQAATGTSAQAVSDAEADFMLLAAAANAMTFGDFDEPGGLNRSDFAAHFGDPGDPEVAILMPRETVASVADLGALFTVCTIEGAGTFAENLANRIEETKFEGDPVWTAARPSFMRSDAAENLDPTHRVPVCAYLYDCLAAVDTGPNEPLTFGLVNVNTAPFQVLQRLPRVARSTEVGGFNDGMEADIAQGLFAYRHRGTDVVDFTDRELATGILGLHDDDGFKSIGEVLAVRAINDVNYPTRQPYVMNRAGADEALDETEHARFISNVISVRSDVFTAWVQLQGRQYDNSTGSWALRTERRFIVMFDRSNIDGSGLPGRTMPRVVLFAEQD